jgi:hypothetical protein
VSGGSRDRKFARTMLKTDIDVPVRYLGCRQKAVVLSHLESQLYSDIERLEQVDVDIVFD